MDKVDDELLNAAANGITRYTELSKKLGLPLSTVHFRMKKLERGGVIRHYRAEVDWIKAGYSMSAFILVNIDVNLLRQINKTQDKLLRELLGVQYVTEGYVITGEADLLLKIMARDPSHLKEILLNHIDAKEGVVKTKTIIVLE
jgi:DNA-binding Lrp family transcriptional regulator